MIRTIQTELAPKPKGPYSQGVICKNGMVYISAQGPIEADTGRFVDGDFKSQVVLVFANISNILKQTGLNLKDVVKVTVYLSDYRYFEELNEVYNSIEDYILENHKLCSLNEILKTTSLSRKKCRRILNELVKRGDLVIIYEGKGKPTIYIPKYMFEEILRKQRKPRWVENYTFEGKKEIERKNTQINKILQRRQGLPPKSLSVYPQLPIPCYFNDGCCGYTNGITCLEIDKGFIRLIKWERSSFERRLLVENNLQFLLNYIKTDRPVDEFLEPKLT